MIGAYIKRWSNLLLLGEEKKDVSSGELESCLRESMDNLRLANVITYLDSSCEGTLPVRDIAELYQIFETVTEHTLGQMNALMVFLNAGKGTVRLRMQMGFHIMPDGNLFSDIVVSGGTVTCEVQEEDVVLNVCLGEGGGMVC